MFPQSGASKMIYRFYDVDRLVRELTRIRACFRVNSQQEYSEARLAGDTMAPTQRQGRAHHRAPGWSLHHNCRGHREMEV